MAEKYVDTFVMPVSRRGSVLLHRQENCRASRRNHPQRRRLAPTKSSRRRWQTVKLNDDEVVVQSWAIYPSKEVRDRANKAIMEDEAFKKLSQHLPVDGKRMFTGGFKVLRGL